MTSHLYGNLPESKNKDLDNECKAAQEWSAVAKAPISPSEPKEQPKEETKPMEPPPAPRVIHLAPPPSVLKKQNKTTPVVAADTHQSSIRETEALKYGFSLFGDLEDEYDPAKPNDYEAVIELREQKRRVAELEAEKQEQLLEQMKEKEQERLDKKRSAVDSNVEGDKQSRRRLSPEGQEYETALEPPRSGESKGMPLAQKMLEKFGWREGEGLGKERQGIATPLIAQKTDNRSAVIVQAQQISKPEPSHVHQRTFFAVPDLNSKQQVPMKGQPTRVVLLRNLVGPGEVDDDLEEEVAVELQKYGDVQRVLIFEVTESEFPPEEAVRIFVEFKTIEEAQKAVMSLNDRFFGGRSIRAGFYDEQKFAECDLAPVSGEFTS